MTWISAWIPLWLVAWLAAAIVVPVRWQPGAMVAVALAFVGWADAPALAWLMTMAMATWLLLRTDPPARWRCWTAALLVLAGFVAAKAGTRLEDSTHGQAPLLGVAFVSLRLVHACIERAVGRLAIGGWWAWIRYLTLFPAVIAGPVHRLDGFQRDERRRRRDPAAMAEGFERMLYGLVKIVVFAGWIPARIEALYDPGDWPDAATGWYTCLRYGWNLYFQFAGYSDIAIGTARAAGYRLPENFAFPFLARNLLEFWQRWHASLSSWCRDYVFAPAMAATRNRVLAVVASMLVLGLWHELSLRYCVWGAFHGLGIAVCQWYAARTASWPHPGRALAWLGRTASTLLTLAFVVLSFAITSSPDLASAWRLVLRMFSLAEG